MRWISASGGENVKGFQTGTHNIVIVYEDVIHDFWLGIGAAVGLAAQPALT